jgi:hypothetical protein
MTRYEEVDTIFCKSGDVVVLSRESAECIAQGFNIPFSQFLEEYQATNINLEFKNKIIGIDLVNAVHKGGFVTKSLLVHSYPEDFQRFLQEDEQTFNEYCRGDPETQENIRGYKAYIQDKCNRKIDPRFNPELDLALGVI